MKSHEQERLLQLLRPRINPLYVPPGHWPPNAKQTFFLSLDDYEVLYGGAAGGSKTEALLLDALKFVEFGNYRCLILRRQKVDLEKSDSILDRALRWWSHRKIGARYLARQMKFVFPSGATIEFGHCQNESDKYAYLGGAWHRIIFDEVVEFSATMYTEIASRCRRTLGEAVPIPLGIRAATNPGGKSHHFFRDRFMTIDFARAFLEDRAPICERRCFPIKLSTGRIVPTWRTFVPSKLRDNPALDADSYEITLHNLDPVRREQLLRGDWLVSASGRFRPEWFGRFRHPEMSVGDHYQILDATGRVRRAIHPDDCDRIMIVDAAGTEKDHETAKRLSRDPSHSVISTFDVTRDDRLMLWRDVERFQEEFAVVCDRVEAAYRLQSENGRRHVRIITETDGIGAQLYSIMQSRGIPIEGIGTGGKDKLTRSARASIEASEGRIFLPESMPWLDALEAELFVWTGLKDEVADQIDTLSYAAIIKTQNFSGPIMIRDRTWG